MGAIERRALPEGGSGLVITYLRGRRSPSSVYRLFSTSWSPGVVLLHLPHETEPELAAPALPELAPASPSLSRSTPRPLTAAPARSRSGARSRHDGEIQEAAPAENRRRRASRHCAGLVAAPLRPERPVSPRGGEGDRHRGGEGRGGLGSSTAPRRSRFSPSPGVGDGRRRE
jgi:hypothetical protein